MPLRSSQGLGRAAVVGAAVSPGPSPVAKAAVGVGAAVSKAGPRAHCQDGRRRSGHHAGSRGTSPFLADQEQLKHVIGGPQRAAVRQLLQNRCRVRGPSGLADGEDRRLTTPVALQDMPRDLGLVADRRFPTSASVPDA
jgi:hypothetical protein